MKINRFIPLSTAILLVFSSAISAAVVRVKTAGNDTNNGSTWALAKKTVQDALDAAASGDEVWVKAGTYTENITTPIGVSLYGGFAGTEVTRKQRNFRVNQSILDGGGLDSVITPAPGSTASSCIDGFTIQNGTGNGAGIYINGASTTIANNIIRNNDGTGTCGGGIFCAWSESLIINNYIMNNISNAGGGIYCPSGGNPTIVGNVIAENEAIGSGGGIYCAWDSPTIRNNDILGNTASAGGGIFSSDDASPTIVNNIIAYSGTSGGIKGTGGTPTLHHNCLYDNQPGGDYPGDWTGGTGDVSADPQIIYPVFDDINNEPNVHLKSTSPCINVGSDSDVQASFDRDIDKQKRIQGTHVDIGADEVAVWQIDLNGNRYGDFLGLTSAGKIYYSTNRVNWIQIPGAMSKLATGDFNDDNNDDIVGVSPTGKIYYTTNKSTWNNIYGTLASVITGDFNGDGFDDIAGLSSSGKIYYTTDLIHWTGISGVLAKLLPVSNNVNGTDALAGLSASGTLFYTENLENWGKIITQFTGVVVGDLYGEGCLPIGIGLKANGSVWYDDDDTENWIKMPGTLSKLGIPGDFNGDGYDDILGLSSTNKIYYSTDKNTWLPIPGTTSSLVTGDYNRDGKIDVGGLTPTGKIRYTTNKTSWITIPGTLSYLCPGRYSPN